MRPSIDKLLLNISRFFINISVKFRKNNKKEITMKNVHISAVHLTDDGRGFGDRLELFNESY